MARVLVVDDDCLTAQMLVEYLTMTGFQATVESNGLLAIQHVDLRPPDLILLDLMLPVVTGVEVARRVRKDPASRHIPILAITAIEDTEEFAEVLMVDAIIRKPIHLDNLGDQVARLLNHQEEPPDDFSQSGPSWSIASAF
jgi:DNA-binding response OmpR family regulator